MSISCCLCWTLPHTNTIRSNCITQAHPLTCPITAIHCNTLQHTASHYNTPTFLHSLPSVVHCVTLQHTATHCKTPRHTATHCSTLQHTTTHCNTLQHTLIHSPATHSPECSHNLSRYACLSDMFFLSCVISCTHGAPTTTRAHTHTHARTRETES